jgi:hypothetical protein
VCLLSAMAETSRLTGMGRLKTMREDMACCRMKLLCDTFSPKSPHDCHIAYLSTRASLVNPAIAIPAWSSILYIFC